MTSGYQISCSSMLGVLNGTYDIAALLFSPIVGYLGETRKKPVWCSCGLLVMGLGYFVFLLPHIMGGYYEAGKIIVGEDIWEKREFFAI